jgi:hypothetical protein
VVTDTTRQSGTGAPRAADEIAIFARLFEERRAAEADASERGTINAREMELVARGVQRHLEYIGRSWLEDAGDRGRPESLVAVLAFGSRADYERHADQALAQLREAEALYRAGGIDLPAASGRRRRSRGSRSRNGRRARIVAIVIIAVILWGVVLAAFGSWGVTDEPLTLTHTERMF